jgi:hypothetical protein
LKPEITITVRYVNAFRDVLFIADTFHIGAIGYAICPVFVIGHNFVPFKGVRLS